MKTCMVVIAMSLLCAVPTRAAVPSPRSSFEIIGVSAGACLTSSGPCSNEHPVDVDSCELKSAILYITVATDKPPVQVQCGEATACWCYTLHEGTYVGLRGRNVSLRSGTTIQHLASYEIYLSSQY